MKLPYSELAAKHQLPDVSQWLQFEEPVSLQEVRKAFQDKLFQYADYVYSIMHPEDLASMAESQLFTDDERLEIEAFYRELMLLTKDCQLNEIAAADEDEVELLQRMLQGWPVIVQRIKAIVEKSKDAYRSNPQHSHHVSYLG